jgi:hypothetical protein
MGCLSSKPQELTEISDPLTLRRDALFVVMDVVFPEVSDVHSYALYTPKPLVDGLPKITLSLHPIPLPKLFQNGDYVKRRRSVPGCQCVFPSGTHSLVSTVSEYKVKFFIGEFMGCLIHKAAGYDTRDRMSALRTYTSQITRSRAEASLLSSSANFSKSDMVIVEELECYPVKYDAEKQELDFESHGLKNYTDNPEEIVRREVRVAQLRQALTLNETDMTLAE